MQTLLYCVTGATAGALYLTGVMPHGTVTGLLLGAAAGWLTGFFTSSQRVRIGRLLGKVWPAKRTPRSFGVNPKELELDEVNYIHEVRTISYHTEIVITVGLLAGLLSIDHAGVEASLWLLSSFLPFHLIEVLCSASFFAIWTLRLGVFAHLFLRSLWIGLVGLGFAYPSGVSRTQLRGELASRFYKHLTPPDTAVRLTIRIEHLSSEAYSVWLSGCFGLFVWTAWLVSSHSLAFVSITAASHAGLDLRGQPEMFTKYGAIVYAIALVIIWSFLRVTQRERIALWRQSILEIFYYYRAILLRQSPSRAVVVSSLPMICFAAGAILPDYFSSRTEYSYLEHHSPSASVNSPALAKMRVDDGHLEIFLNQRYLAATGVDLQGRSTAPPSSPVTLAEQIGVAIDGSEIDPPEWMITARSGRPVLYSTVSVHHLPSGPHHLNLASKTSNPLSVSIPFFVLHDDHLVRDELSPPQTSSSFPRQADEK